MSFGASQPGFWRFGNRHMQDKILAETRPILVGYVGNSRNAIKGECPETVRTTFLISKINFLPLLLRQNTLSLPCAGFLAGRDQAWLLFHRPGRKSSNSHPRCSGPRSAIRILDDLHRARRFTFDRQVRGQGVAFPNQNVLAPLVSGI